MNEPILKPEPPAGFETDPDVTLLPGGFGSNPYRVKYDVRYYSRRVHRWIHIPAGFRSDLLSIPWTWSRVFPRGGYGKRAAIAHDWLCVDRPDWSSSDDAADVFDEALKIDGVPTWRRRMMVWAVRHFGPQWPRMAE